MKQNKIAVVIAILFFAFMSIYSAWNDLSSDQKELDNAALVEERLLHIIKINEVITELQKERGLTTIYNAAANDNITSALLTQRQMTSALLAAATTKDIKSIITKRDQILHQFKRKDPNKVDTFEQYTSLILQLMGKSEDLVFLTRNSEIKNSLMLYHLLKNAQEHIGGLRAKVGTVIATKTLSAQNHNDIIRHKAIYQHQMQKVQRHQVHIDQQLLHDMQKQPCLQQTFLIVEHILNESLQTIEISPIEWFKLSTCSVTSVVDTTYKHLEHMQLRAKQMTEEAEHALLKHLLFWIGGGLTLVMLLVITLNRSKELTKKHQLLENYKEAIDYSTIVSKADKNGTITYINSAFCDISGYEEDELLHRPHNIVRHPDMPKEVFKVMWETLQEGKKWNGIVKNLKKDGTAYWVDASISPIFDENGELIEYISIRRDITDIILLNEEIRHTQSELIYRMGEAVESRSKESGHHVQRVAHYSKLLAQLAGLDKEECEIMFSASTMHDVGKLAIPDAILLKADILTEEEWVVMRTHAEVGYKILAGSERPLLKMAATVAYEHHEHFDGNGYPRGIKADEISIYGRIVAITDVFDALATDRIYKEAWPLKDIFEHLKEQSGKQFDPELIELVLNHLDQFLEIKSKFQDQ